MRRFNTITLLVCLGILCGISFPFLTIAEDAFSTTNAATLVVSTAHPVSVKDKALRKAVADLCKEMLDAPAGKFGAHPSSEIFPGAVSNSAPRITRSIQLSHTPPSPEMLRLIQPLDYSSPFSPNLYSTELYAAPGEVVTVTVPLELTGQLSVQIGCQTDSLNEWMAVGEDWRRMPLITNERKLDTVRTEISNPFGGLIYITCAPTNKAWQGAITVSNAVMCPRYVLGVTTPEQWKTMLENTGAPWGEIGTTNIILMLPVTALKKIEDPQRCMEIWDNVIGSEMDLAQLPRPFYRAQRLVTDVHIGGGFMHSGYPIMVHHCPEKGMATEEFISHPERFSLPANGGPNWGFFHEIGHNMQNIDWVFDGTTEVSVNLFSLYCFDKICGGRDNAHDGVSSSFTRKAQSSYFSKKPDFKKWQSDPFLALTTFRLLQNDFGWELFKRTFRRYQALEDSARPVSDADKRDRLVTYLSETAERNFAPYFSEWGVPLSDKTKSNLEKYPLWMPYNFPPGK